MNENAETHPSGLDLVACLVDAGSRADRRLCEQIVHAIASGELEADALFPLLRTAVPEVRFSSAWILFQVGRRSLRLLPALLDALDLPDGDRRWGATELLVLLGRLHDEVYPVVVHEASQSERPSRRRMAIYALRELGPERPATEALYLRALEDPDSHVRRAALSSLAKLIEPSSACFTAALDVLERDPDPRMRNLAAVLVVDLSQNAGEQERALDGLRRAAEAYPALVPAARIALERLRRKVKNENRS